MTRNRDTMLRRPTHHYARPIGLAVIGERRASVDGELDE